MTELVLLHLSALLIGLSKAGFGGGTGIVVGPILLLILPAKETIGLMLPLLFACDIVSLYFYWKKWDWSNLVVLIPGAFVGIGSGYFLLDSVSDDHLKTIIGIAAIGFAFFQVYRRRFGRQSRLFQPRVWHGTISGLVTGFISTLAHIGGTVTTMYLLPQNLPNRTFVATTTAFYFLINLCKIPVYLQLNVLDLSMFNRILPLLPMLFFGTGLGVYLNRRVSNSIFSMIILLIVILTGLKLLFW